MHNLLTGKVETREFPEPKPNPTVEKPWTAEDYLTAMRRLLNDAARSPDPAVMVAAAGVLAKAAVVAARTPLPVKTAPARTAPRDGDAI